MKPTQEDTAHRAADYRRRLQPDPLQEPLDLRRESISMVAALIAAGRRVAVQPPPLSALAIMPAARLQQRRLQPLELFAAG